MSLRSKSGFASWQAEDDFLGVRIAFLQTLATRFDFRKDSVARPPVVRTVLSADSNPKIVHRNPCLVILLEHRYDCCRE